MLTADPIGMASLRGVAGISKPILHLSTLPKLHSSTPPPTKAALGRVKPNSRNVTPDLEFKRLKNSQTKHRNKIQMKITLYSIAFAIMSATAVMAADTTIETTETTTNKADGSSMTTIETTTSTGTITEYNPGSTFIVKENNGPVKYNYGESVTYVTKSGKTITKDDLKSRIRVGTPVSVDYVTEGETRVINRVVVGE